MEVVEVDVYLGTSYLFRVEFADWPTDLQQNLKKNALSTSPLQMP